MYRIHSKYFIDSFLTLFCFIFLSPFIIIVISSLIVSSGDLNIFFIQQRPGKNAKIFKLIKFKTMNNKRDINGYLLPDNERITKIGKLLRSLSLDELPQLINVLKGDMSLVGPRPLLIEYLPLYTPEQARRHEVKPGITGWAQVNGRNAISWKKKFEYDVWYVDHISFWLDMKILYLTVRKVFVRDGINASENVTMEPFNGNN